MKCTRSLEDVLPSTTSLGLDSWKRSIKKRLKKNFTKRTSPINEKHRYELCTRASLLKKCILQILYVLGKSSLNSKRYQLLPRRT